MVSHVGFTLVDVTGGSGHLKEGEKEGQQGGKGACVTLYPL
jgi:hypothetical protein